MRQAGTLPNREQAQRFVDFLISQEIAAKSDPQGEAWAIWIRDEDHLHRALAELRQFAADPAADRYQGVSQAAQIVRKQQELDDRQRRRNIIEVRDRWNLSPAGRRPITILLIVISGLVSLATDFGQDRKSELLQKLWFSPLPSENLLDRIAHPWTPTKAIEDGQVWRLVTPIFIHYSPMHLFFNMYALYLFGSLIEIRRGTIQFAVLAFIVAIVSNFSEYYITAHFAWAGPASIWFGGMSGVDFGLFGYLWIKSRFDPGAGFYMPPSLVVQSLIWLVLCFTGLLGPIANWAHTSGLAAGAIIAYLPVAWRKLF